MALSTINPLREQLVQPPKDGDDPDLALINISLHRKQSSLGQHQTTCISKHYALNQQILQAFETHYQQSLFRIAFYLGLKFVETALIEIPKHGYYYSNKFADLRIQSSKDAIRVTRLLQGIIAQNQQQQQQSNVEDDTFMKESIKLERLHYLATEQQYERLDTYETKRALVEQEINRMYYNQEQAAASTGRPLGSHRGRVSKGQRQNSSGRTYQNKSLGSSSLGDCDVGSTLLACGESISSVFCPSSPMSSPTRPSQRNKYPPMPTNSNYHEIALVKTPYEQRKSIHQQRDDTSGSTKTRLPPLPPGRSSSLRDIKLFPPQPNVQRSSSSSLFPPSLESGLINSPSLLDDTIDDEDNNSEQAMIGEDSSAYTYGNGRTRVNQNTVYLPEENKLPPSYNDIFNLHGNNDEKKDTINGYDNNDNNNNHRNSNMVGTGIPLEGTGINDHTRSNSGGSSSMYWDPSGHIRTQSDYDLQRALYLSGLEVMTESRMWEDDNSQVIKKTMINGIERRDDAPAPASDIAAPPGAKRKQSTSDLPLEMLRNCYHEDFDVLRGNGRVVISQLPTYQGRVRDSINGCTVIAPLLCIHHFHNDEAEDGTFIKKSDDGFPDPALPDQIIVEVIDEETPNILPAVRKNLGLVPDAFLIPVDAHESLMEQNYMCREQFLTVCGGNILDDNHMEPLLQQLSKVGPKKLAATFFFHEHVITILQLRRSPDKVWFDIIDSLPHPATLRRKGEDEQLFGSLDSDSAILSSDRDFTSSGMSRSSSINAASSDGYYLEGTLPRRPSSSVMSEGEGDELDDNERRSQQMLFVGLPSPQNAVRIRCLDVEALKATLRWYACSVFTSENSAYIDTYQWDDALADFDPRVFQAFIWTEVR